MNLLKGNSANGLHVYEIAVMNALCTMPVAPTNQDRNKRMLYGGQCMGLAKSMEAILEQAYNYALQNL